MAGTYRWYRVLENGRGEPQLCSEVGSLWGKKITFQRVSDFSNHKQTGQMGQGVYFRTPEEAVGAYKARLEAANRSYQQMVSENGRKMASAEGLIRAK